MALVRVSGFTISADGYGAGPDQTIETPLGVGGEELHKWMIDTSTFHRMSGKSGGSVGVDDDIVASGMSGIGAWIMGRKMFGPVRGAWPDESCTERGDGHVTPPSAVASLRRSRRVPRRQPYLVIRISLQPPKERGSFEDDAMKWT
jgi:dihydrofolate reductase